MWGRDVARIVRKRKPAEPPKLPLAELMEKHLADLRQKNYSEYTIKGRRVHIGFFLDWAHERGITEPVDVTRTILERCQKHVFDYRESNGEPLGFGGQHDRIVPLRVWFKWMARQHHILHNPASEIEPPRTPQGLPKAVLSASEAERVLACADIDDTLGLRDRAILEAFYSTGMRRLELATLKLWDLDLERATATIRLGKARRTASLRSATAGPPGSPSTSSSRGPGSSASPTTRVSFYRMPASRSRSIISPAWCANTSMPLAPASVARATCSATPWRR